MCNKCVLKRFNVIFIYITNQCDNNFESYYWVLKYGDILFEHMFVWYDVLT